MKNPLLPVARVTLGLLVAGACFQAGRWTGRLEREAARGPRVDPGNELVTAKHVVPPGPVETKPAVASGDPVGETGDVITPLNVRDPSALVLGPGGGCPSPQAVTPPPPPPARMKREAPPLKEPLPEGRLLDLLKKRGEQKNDEPKVY